MIISIKNKLASIIIDKIIRRWILKFLPNKLTIVFDYFITYKKFPDLNNPKTISDKIQWIKLYGNLEKYAKYVDKYEVRKHISRTIGNKYLIPLIGVWNNFDEIPFDKLPKQFVLKATHGSGYVFICKNKSQLDMDLLKNTITKWMSENYYKLTREIQYKGCKPRIICEKYLENKSGGLKDYKIYVSNEKPEIIEVIWDRFTDHKSDNFMDLNWNKLSIFYPEHPPSQEIIQKPKNMDEMISIAKILSKPFPFVRVDLYSVNNKIFFGELTLTPDNGMGIFEPNEANYQLGKLIDLSKYKL